MTITTPQICSAMQKFYKEYRPQPPARLTDEGQALIAAIQSRTSVISWPRLAGKTSLMKSVWRCDYCGGANAMSLSCVYCNAPMPVRR